MANFARRLVLETSYPPKLDLLQRSIPKLMRGTTAASRRLFAIIRTATCNLTRCILLEDRLVLLMYICRIEHTVLVLFIMRHK